MKITTFLSKRKLQKERRKELKRKMAFAIKQQPQKECVLEKESIINHNDT